jgi:hypothetical protein
MFDIDSIQISFQGTFAINHDLPLTRKADNQVRFSSLPFCHVISLLKEIAMLQHTASSTTV